MTTLSRRLDLHPAEAAIAELRFPFEVDTGPRAEGVQLGLAGDEEVVADDGAVIRPLLTGDDAHRSAPDR